MPNNAEHCEDSLRRYGKTFSELHKWMDEPSAILGKGHRKYRHDPITTPKESKALFGENADNACLDHIRLDELETRRKGNKSLMTVNVTIGDRKHPQNDPVRVGVISILAFIFGLLLYSQNFWLAIVLFIISGFGFLVTLGSLSSPNSSHVTETTEIDNEGKMDIIKTCPNCGTVFDYHLERCPNCGQDFFIFH